MPKTQFCFTSNRVCFDLNFECGLFVKGELISGQKRNGQPKFRGVGEQENKAVRQGQG